MVRKARPSTILHRPAPTSTTFSARTLSNPAYPLAGIPRDRIAASRRARCCPEPSYPRLCDRDARPRSAQDKRLHGLRVGRRGADQLRRILGLGTRVRRSRNADAATHADPDADAAWRRWGNPCRHAPGLSRHRSRHLTRVSRCDPRRQPLHPHHCSPRAWPARRLRRPTIHSRLRDRFPRRSAPILALRPSSTWPMRSTTRRLPHWNRAPERGADGLSPPATPIPGSGTLWRAADGCRARCGRCASVYAGCAARFGAVPCYSCSCSFRPSSPAKTHG